MVLYLYLNLRPASPALLLHHHNLLIDLILQFAHMGNDSHQAAAVGLAHQGVVGLAQRVFVQAPEAFIHKHGVHLDPSGAGLDLLRQSQGQGQ